MNEQDEKDPKKYLKKLKSNISNWEVFLVNRNKLKPEWREVQDSRKFFLHVLLVFKLTWKSLSVKYTRSSSEALISHEQDIWELWNKAVVPQSTWITSNNPMLAFEKVFAGLGLKQS